MKRLLILWFLVITSFSILAEDTSQIKWSPGLRLWGADLVFSYGDYLINQKALTWLDLFFGGSYEDFGYYRNPDNSLYIPSETGDDLSRYKTTKLDWGLAFRQGILFDQRKNDNLLEIHWLYRGVFASNDHDKTPDALIYKSGLIDSDGILFNSLALGMFLNDIYKNKHNAVDGFSLDITAEFAPLFFFNNINATSDYSRITFDTRGFLSILDLENCKKPDQNLFSIYLGDRVIFDALFGNIIPILPRQSIGGRKLSFKTALGGAVRGIESHRFDGYLKLINNFDIRFNLPGFELFDMSFLPGFLFYFDSAVKSDLDYNIDVNEIYNSTGVALFMSHPWLDFILSLDYFINNNKLSFSFAFSFQFS